MLEIFLSGLILAVSPGPDFFLMSRNTLSGGRALGYSTLLGNRIGIIMHITFAILGLSLILQQSAIVFTSVRILGALYLIYLGYKKIKGGWKIPAHPQVQLNTSVTKLQALRMGFLSNCLNPKVSMFFLSIFPQVVSTEQLAQQPLLVVLVFLFGNSIWYVTILMVIGMNSIRGTVQNFQHRLDIIFGFIFILFGGKIIWETVRNYFASPNRLSSVSYP